MNEDGHPLRKDEEEAVIVRPPRIPLFFRIILMAPGLVFTGLAAGVVGRITVEFFQWGWDLFGWA